MISEILPHLETLSAKYQTNQSRLVKPEADEAGRLLREALAESSKGIDLFFRFATVLPPDAVSSAIVDKWSAFEQGSRDQVMERLQKLPEPGGRRLRLVLSRALQKIDPALARRTLTQVCYSLIDSKTQRISKKNSVTFRTAMLDERAPALIGFRFSNPIQAEVAALLTCILGTVFSQDEDIAPHFSPVAPQVLKWLWSEGLFTMLKPLQHTALFESIKLWPQKAKEDLISTFKPLPAEFEFLTKLPGELSPAALIVSSSTEPKASPVVPVPAPPLQDSTASTHSDTSEVALAGRGEEHDPEQRPSLISPTSPIALSDSTDNQKGTPSQSSPAPASTAPRATGEMKPSARELLAQLADLVKELETANRAARSEITEQRTVIQGLKSRVFNADNNFHKLEIETREAQHQTEVLKTDLNTVRREAARLLDETDALRTELAEAKTRHDKEAEALAGRVTIESARVVEAFKNGVARKLRLEWRDFEDVSGTAMTLDIGESHRRQLREIFALLEREGMPITK